MLIADAPGAALGSAAHALSLSNLIINLAFIGVIALATMAIAVALAVVTPEIARALLGKTEPGKTPLSPRKRLLLALSLALGIFGPITEGIGIISQDALLSDAGLALVIGAVCLGFISR